MKGMFEPPKVTTLPGETRTHIASNTEEVDYRERKAAAYREMTPEQRADLLAARNKVRGIRK